MTTFTELANKYDVKIEQKTAYKNTTDRLNEEFEKNWTSLFKDKIITDKWFNKEPEGSKILIPITEQNREYYLVVKNSTINKIEVLGLDAEITPKYFTSDYNEVYKQISEKIIALKLERDFVDVSMDSLLAKYILREDLYFNRIIDVMKYVLGYNLVTVNGNNIIINQTEIDCTNLLFFKKYYISNRFKQLKNEPLNSSLKIENTEISLEMFKVIQEHTEYKELLPTILNDLAKAYWKEIERHFSLEKFNKVKERFEVFRNKHQIDKYWGLNGYVKDYRLGWNLIPISHEDYTYNYLENNYEFLRCTRDISEEAFDRSIGFLEEDLLRFLTSHIVNVTGLAIYYDCLFKINQIKNTNQDFKETINYKGKDITISKTYDYFIMNYKDYLCVHYLPNDRMFSFSNPTLKINEIECLKDFEEQVEKDVEFLIEFLNS